MNTSITNMTALQSNVRFLMMHGVADDNVHMQNSLTLLDKLDLAGVENYDVHVFPDSDHGIYFHNANKMVYDSKSVGYLLTTLLISRRAQQLAHKCLQWRMATDRRRGAFG